MLASKYRDSGPLLFTHQRQYNENPMCTAGFVRKRFLQCKNMYTKDLRAHYGCVNAIEFSNSGGEWISSGGDDKRVLMWQVEKALSGVGKPEILKREHNSNIFCLAFDNENKKIFSGGNDEIVMVHDLVSGDVVDVFQHDEAVYGISVHPVNDSVFASACEDGRILIYDIREPPQTEPFCLANYVSAMHAVVFNPMEPRLVATANSKEGVALWDIRRARTCLQRFGGGLIQQSCMSVRFNQKGDHLIALRRRLPPVLYNIKSPEAVFQFDHPGYYNSCTMKSCCFAGDKDQYLISGSDDFNLYVWQIPDEPKETDELVRQAHLVLRGHRSIVNQVRFNPANHLIISSGVEKVIKVWSPFMMPEGTGGISLDNDELERPVYSHDEYINLVLHSGHVMTHDYTNESTDEDPRMMAFFDSLVQRELEDWSSDSLSSLTDDSDFYDYFVDSISDPVDTSDVETGNRHPAPQAREELQIPNTGRVETPSESTESSRDDSGMTFSPDNLQRRRCISVLIEKKRKSYVSTLLNKTNNKTENEMASSSKKNRDLSSSSSSTSGSSSDDSEPTKNLKKSSSDVERTITKVSTRLLEQATDHYSALSRLRRLRTQALNEDGESRPVSSPVAGTSHSDNNSTNVLDNNCETQATEETKLSNNVSTSNCKSCPDHTNGTLPNHTCENNSSPETSNNSTVEQPPDGATGDNDITWSEFKRFKNRVERARRKYRRRSQQEESSGEDS